MTKILNVRPSDNEAEEGISVERVATVAMEMAAVMFKKTSGPVEAVAAVHVVIRAILSRLCDVEGFTADEAREVITLGMELARRVSIVAHEATDPVTSQSGGQA